jgi:VWFA-related protein
MRTIALIAVVAILNATAGSAWQNKPGSSQEQSKEPFKLSVATHFVLVPVIVTDKQGNHVTGLKAEDFELKEDGSVQKISRLDELTADTVKVPVAATSPKEFTNQVVADHPKKLEIIAFDQVNTPFASSRDGERMLVEFLAKNVDANTLLALVALGHNGPRIIHDFTHDPGVLIAAVKKLQTSLNSRDSRTLESSGDSTEADFEALQIAAILNGSDTGNITTPQQMAAVGKAQRAQVDASRQAQEGLITLENFQKLAQYFQGVPGRKSLIWASTAFPFSLGAAAQATTRGTTNDDWQRTFRMLTDANIAVYPVDIGGLLPGVSANTLQSIDSAGMIKNGGPDGGTGQRGAVLAQIETGAFVDPTIGRHDTMHQVADMTGGQAFYNSNDGAELFRRAGEDAAQYYMLGYYTRDTGKFGWRKLAVKVNRDGVHVRARSGFVFSDPKKEADVNTPLKDLKMALGSDLSFTSIPIRGQWQQIEPAGNQKKIHFTLSIPPGVAAIDAEQQNHISLEFLITAMDASGKSAANISQRLDTKLPPEGVEQIQTQGIDYANALTLPPNSYTIHFVVRDNLRGTLGSVVTPLKLE